LCASLIGTIFGRDNVACGNLEFISVGGLKGGPARAKKLSAAQRKTIAKKAAMTRWKKEP
jgi:hypothetical protein